MALVLFVGKAVAGGNDQVVLWTAVMVAGCCPAPASAVGRALEQSPVL